MINNCPTCDRPYDFDGFSEHGTETLYYCECGQIFDQSHRTYALDQIDMSNLAGTGQFIKASRIKPALQDDEGSPILLSTESSRSSWTTSGNQT